MNNLITHVMITEKLNVYQVCETAIHLVFLFRCSFSILVTIEGWQGDLCDVPMCRKGCDPMHGYCKKPGECRCNLGFYGDKCDRCIPLPGCQHGYCNVSFECICNKGWDGLFCTDRKKFFLLLLKHTDFQVKDFEIIWCY